MIILGVGFMGFNLGLVKIGSGIIGMYGGIQVAALFYEIFANLTATPGSQSSIDTNQILWFFGLWVAWSIIFTLVAWSFTQSIVIPVRLGNLNQLVGLALGMFAGIFGLFVVAFVLRNTFTVIWLSSGRPDNWMHGIVTGFDKSVVFGILKALKVVYLNILSPWLPVAKIPVFRDAPLF
jgi:uncharacterized membrane protein required for colicin V production